MNNILYHYTNNEAAINILCPKSKDQNDFIHNSILSLIRMSGQKTPFDKPNFIQNSIENSIKTEKIICKDKLELFISNIRNLNDPSETFDGYKSLKKHIKKNYYSDRILINTLEFLEKKVNNKKIIDSLTDHTYIFSLTSLKNNLNQWRLYGDDGYGISLGFNSEILRKIINSKFIMQLNKIYYKKEDLYSHFDDNYKSFGFSKSVNGSGELEVGDGKKIEVEYDELKQLTYIMVINSIISMLKNNCYEVEDEIRVYFSTILMDLLAKSKETGIFKLASTDFIDYLDNDCFYSYNRNLLKQYKKIRIPIEAISEIWIGPKNNTSIRIMENYIRSLGYTNINVYKSKLPYK